MNFKKNTKAFLNGFFSKGHIRTIEAKRNILAVFFLKGVSIVTSLFLVPLTINYVNPTRYGIWLTLTSIVAWFSFFDMGFGNGLRNRFAESKARSDTITARCYVSTTYAVLIIIFFLVWILFFVGNFFLDWSNILNAPDEYASELSILALIVVSFFCLQIVLKLISTILIADQKPAKSSLIDALGQLGALSIVFILTKTTKGSLINLGLALGATPLIILAISSLWYYNKTYKIFAPSLKFVDFKYAKDILTLGIKFFVIQVAAIVIYQTSNIIIAHTCSPKDVTVYNIAFKYFSVGTMLFTIILTPFWSAVTDAFTIRDFAWIKRLYKKLRHIALIVILLVFIMVLLAPYAYEIWIGDAVNVRTTISFVVAIYIITNIWNALNSTYLNGMGKIQLQLYISIFCMSVNIPLAIFLGKEFGIEGVVLSSVIINVLSAVFAPIQIKKLLDKNAKGIWNR